MRKILIWCAALLGVLSSGCGGGGGGGSSTAVIGPLSASATSVSFSTTQPVGTSAAIQAVTLTNNNTSELTLTSITLTGSNPASFAEASDCPTILSASASCTIWVTFGPTAAAAATASVNVVSNATNSSTVVTLTGTGVANTSPANVLSVTVDPGPIGFLAADLGNQFNQPYTSVMVCTPGSSSDCQVIDHILVVSYLTGLRIMASALNPGGTSPAGGAVPVPVTIGGSPLRECMVYDGYAWGSVVTADVYLGGYLLSSLPIQLMGDTASGAAPSDCAATGNNLGSVQSLAANGILGINSFASNYDCPTCATAAQATTYYSCPSGGSCASTAVPLASQLVNPISQVPTYNNGAILALDAPAATGAQSASGTLTLGINIDGTNQLGTTPLLTVSSIGAFTTSFAGTVYTSYISSAATTNYFPSSTITLCDDSNFYCPATPLTETATLIGANNAQVVETFAVTNADVDFGNADFSALPGLSEPYSANFIWGVPFFYGKSVYLLYAGQTVAGVTGPAIGF
jgi:hypothetical protein